MESRGFGGRGGDDNCVIHRAGFFQFFDNLGDFGFLLADSDINADWSREASVFALVDYRIDRKGGFSGLSVAESPTACSSNA